MRWGAGRKAPVAPDADHALAAADLVGSSQVCLFGIVTLEVVEKRAVFTERDRLAGDREVVDEHLLCGEPVVGLRAADAA